MGARQEERIMGVRVGIVGVSGYGGSELLRLCVGHPAFEVVYASGETTAGQRLSQQFPALAGHPTGSLVIQPFVPEELHGVDVLFASLAHGQVARAARAGSAGREDRRRGRRPPLRRGLDLRADRAAGHSRGRRAVVPRRGPGLLSGGGAAGAGAARRRGAGGAGGPRDRRQDRRERRGSRRRGERVRLRRDQRGRDGLRPRRASPRPGDAGGPDAARRPAGHARLHAAPGPDDARDPRDLLRAAARAP